MNKTFFQTTAIAFASILVILNSGFGPNVKKAHASQDSGSGFTITPPVFDLKANPGDQLQEVVSVYNNGSQDLDINTTLENLRPIGEVGQVQVVDSGLPSLKDWVQVNTYDTKIKPGETRNVSFSIKVPGNAEPGGHFATVLFGTNPTNDLSTSGSKVAQKIGSLLLLTVSGQAKEDTTVTHFTTDKTKYFDYSPIKFDLRLQNNGNTYVHPKGYISITNIFGHKVAEIEVTGKNILPGATRQLPETFKPKNLFGPYTASLSLVYGTANKNLNSSIGFMIIPWKQTVIVLGIIIVVILLRKRLWRALLVIVGKKKA